MTINASLIAADVVEWLHGSAVQIEDTMTLVSELGHRLKMAGAPVDRLTTGIPILHPNVRAESVLWTSAGEMDLRRYVETPQLDLSYERSPIKVLRDTGEKVRVRIGSEPVEGEFEIISDLRPEGYTDYVALPMPFSDGSTKVLTVASKAPGGFTGPHIAMLETVVRPLGLLCELQTLKRTARTLLETYVGRRAGRRVLEGTIKRGDGETISAVVGFADLRGFTSLSNDLPAQDLVTLLNQYFGALTAAVESQGGEVLKFIGDEVMAVFPYECDQTARGAAQRALWAAHAAVERIALVNRTCCEDAPKIRAGIALHAGDVFFGNVGGESRLDFTVIGPTVNLASRLAGLSRDLDENIVVSEAIADMIGCRAGHRGEYQVKGFAAPVSVFVPPVLTAGAACWDKPETQSALALEKN